MCYILLLLILSGSLQIYDILYNSYRFPGCLQVYTLLRTVNKKQSSLFPVKLTHFTDVKSSVRFQRAHSEQADIAHACYVHALQLSTELSCLGQKVSS